MMPTPSRFSARPAFHLAAHIAIGAVTLAGATGTAQAQPATARVSYDVPAGPLAEALNRFALQSGVSIVVDADKAQGLRAPALKGAYGVDEGFGILLQGSGYTIGRTPAGYVLVPAPPQPVQSGQKPPAPQPEPVLPAVKVKATAEPPSSEPPRPYAGGQVARGARAGLLGDKDYMETPFSITSYTDEAIRSVEARTRLQVLELDPSVTRAIGTIEAQDQFVVRGFNVFGFQATVDGLTGMAGISGRDAELYERIELTKGPSALLNGASSAFNVGGSVNLVTKYAYDEPLARLNTRWSEKSEVTHHLDFGRRFGPENQFGVRVNLVRGDGARNTVDAGAEPEFERKLTSLSLDYRGERFRVKWNTFRLDDDQSVSGTISGLSLDADDPTQPIRRPLFGLRDTDISRNTRTTIAHVEADVANDTTASVSYGRSAQVTTQRYIYATALDPATGDVTLTNGLYAAWSSTYSAKAALVTSFKTGPVSHQLAFDATRTWSKRPVGDAEIYTDGATYQTNLYNQASAPLLPLSLVQQFYDGKSKRDYTRAVADTLGFWGDRLLLTLGVRKVDSIKDTTPSISALFKATPQFSVYGNYIEGVQERQRAPLNTSPIPEEQIVNPGEEFAATPNKQREIGAKLDFGNVGATAALFEIEQISYYADRSTRRYGPEGLQTNRGLELNVFGKPWSGLVLSGGYAYLDAKLSRTEDPALQGHSAGGVPKHTLALWGTWAVPSAPGLSLVLRSRTQTSQFVDSTNAQRVSGQTIFAAGATYATKLGVPVVLRATVENLADKRYYVSFSRGRVAEGTPRTVTLSAQVDL